MPGITWDDAKPATASPGITWDDAKPATAQTQASATSRFAKSAYDSSVGPVVAIGNDFARHAQENEKLGGLGGIAAGAQTGYDMAKGVTDGWLDALDKTTNAIKAGDYKGAALQSVGLVPVVGPVAVKASDQARNGDYAGSAGTLTGVALSALAPKIPGAVGDAVEGARGAVQAIKSSPVASALAAKYATKVAINLLPGKGIIRTVMDTGEFWDGLKSAWADMKKEAAAQPAAQPAPAPAASDATVSMKPIGDGSTSISNRFSLDSASNKWKTSSAAPDQGSTGWQRPTLSQDTHGALATAANNGKLAALPADAKAVIVQAVKTGDEPMVNAVLKTQAAPTVSDIRVMQANAAKAEVILDYAHENSIDLKSVPEAGRDTIAQAALAYRLHKYAATNNIDLGSLTADQMKATRVAAGLPKGGKYTVRAGSPPHESSFDLVNRPRDQWPQPQTP